MNIWILWHLWFLNILSFDFFSYTFDFIFPFSRAVKKLVFDCWNLLAARHWNCRMKKREGKKWNHATMLGYCCHAATAIIQVLQFVFFWLLTLPPLHCINCALSNEKFCSSAFTQRHRRRSSWMVCCRESC